MPPQGLLALQKQYILDQIKGIQLSGSLYILIIDDKIESILYQVIKKDQLLRIVTSIEKIDERRKQQTFLEAIYFVEPTVYTLNCVIGDVLSYRYKKGHGLFLPIFDNSDVYQFYQSKKFLQNPKVQNYFDFGENIRFIQSSFHPVENRVFLVDNQGGNSMPIYFNENCSDLVLTQIQKVALALVNLMVITGEYPLIRFYSPQNQFFYKATRLSELIADEFQRQIDDHARNNHDFPPVPEQNKARSILLIVDRTIDLYAPLLHEFSYQAMAMDIVPSLEREGCYVYNKENERGEVSQQTSYLNNEDDEDWTTLRHLHIIESNELIINKINQFIQDNPLMVDRSQALTASDLMHIVANLSGFDKERAQMSLHKKLIDECLELNDKRKLAEFAADFEQTCCAEGFSFEGERNKHLHEDLIVLLARDDLHVNDKMRLVLIYGLYRGGLIEEDFVKLAKFIGVKNTQIISLISRCFINLHKLGFPIVKENIQDPQVKKKLFHTINNDGTYNTSRFGPGLKSILQYLIKYQLNEDWFPYFRDKPLDDDIPADIDINNKPQNVNTSLRNSRIKASWANAPAKVSDKSKQRIFCFIAGGMTYSEMRSIYELSSSLDKDFFLGSDTILKPRDFLIGLQGMDTAKLMEDLNLPLYKELSTRKEPPTYLFENTEKHFTSRTPSTNATVDFNQNLNQVNIDFNNFNMNQEPVSASVPSHYQKRNSTMIPKTKEKGEKRKVLGKLFK